MTSRQRYLLKRIYSVLSNEALVIEFNARIKCRGDTDTETIRLNPRCQLLPTLIHEVLHIVYPRKQESAILALEESLCRALSDRQWITLLNKLNRLM